MASIEMAYAVYHALEGKVFPKGINPRELPAERACQLLEDLDQIENHILQFGETGWARTLKGKKSDPFQLAAEINQLKELGKPFRGRRKF